MKCFNCGYESSEENLNFCPSCGAVSEKPKPPQETKSSSKGKKGPLIKIIAILLAFLLGAGATFGVLFATGVIDFSKKGDEDTACEQENNEEDEKKDKDEADKDDDDKDDDDKDIVAVPTEPVTEEEKPVSNAYNKTMFYIGATGPLTGVAASYGTSVKQGAQLAIDEINAQGGLNGIKFKFDMKDDKATAEDAKNGYKALYDDGMQVSLGSVTSASAKAFATLAAEDGVFSITPSASMDDVINASEYSFRACFGDPDFGAFSADFLSREYESIGVIYDISDAYCSGLFDAFDTRMKELNKDFTVMTFDCDTNRDFSAQVEALRDCDVIFLPVYYSEAGLIAKTCAEKDCDAVLYGCDGLDGIAEQIDRDVVKNEIIYITPFDVNSTDEKVANFVKAYEAEYYAKPDQFAASAYDTVYAIYEAMKLNGIDDPTISASELGEILVSTFTDSYFTVDGVTGELSWDDSGACMKAPVAVIVP